MPNNRKRDSNGRFTAADHSGRNRAFGVAAVIGLGAAAVGAAIRYGLLDRFLPPSEGHEAPDLALDAVPAGTERAPEAFRPDPTAVPTGAEREALRPPAGVDRGFMVDDTRAEELTAAE